MTVSGHTAFPADGFTARWVWLGEGPEQHEDLTLRWDNEAWTASATLARERVEVVIRVSPMWQVRQLLLFRDLDQPDLWLGTDGHGHWGEVNGVQRRELDGASDVTVAVGGVPVSAFVHTIPVRRLPLDVGGSFDTRSLEVDVETLAVEPVLRTYRRIDVATWQVSQAGEVTELTVDEYGLPVAVGGRFRRVA